MKCLPIKYSNFIGSIFISSLFKDKSSYQSSFISSKLVVN
nr:MAG TPA: hypothetical protein [Caudoviricetes sp.]